MRTVSRATNDVDVTVECPEDWYVTERCVPALAIPHELWGISNRSLISQSDPERAQPMVRNLPADLVLLWAYYQAPGDPVWARDDLPDYRRWQLPFEYAATEAYPAGAVRDWDVGKFVWRRIGA